MRARGSILRRLETEGIAVQAALGTVLRGVDRDEPVAHCFVEDPHERGDGVLDRRGPVPFLPGIDGAVDDPGGDLRDRQVP